MCPSGQRSKTLYDDYSAMFDTQQASVKLLTENHDSALVLAKWSAAGLAPPLLLSEHVHQCIGGLEYATSVHMVRNCPRTELQRRTPLS